MSINKDDLIKAVNLTASRGKMTPGSQSIVISNLNATNLPSVIGGDLDLGTTFPSIVKIIADASGSMSAHTNPMIAALNATKNRVKSDSQRIGFEAHLSFTSFDDNIRTNRPFEDVLTLRDFDYSDYAPNGLTNLYGAGYQGITDTLLYGSLVYTAGAVGYQQFVILMSDGMPEGPQSKSLDETRNLVLEYQSMPHAAVVLIGFGNPSIYTKLAASLGIANVRTYDPSNPNWLDDMVWDLSSNISHHSQRASQGQSSSVSGNFFAV